MQLDCVRWGGGARPGAEQLRVHIVHMLYVHACGTHDFEALVSLAYLTLLYVAVY